MTQQKFAVFDIDGTLFRSGLYREVVFEMMHQDLLPESFSETINPKFAQWQKRSHDDAFESFQSTLVELFEDQLPSLAVDDYEHAVQEVLRTKGDNVYSYTRKLVQDLKQAGYFMLAISGSQIELVEPFARRYGFDDWIGQTLTRQGKNFTGEVVESHTKKDQLLNQLVEKHNLSFNDSYGVGDTVGDIGLLESVDNPIAFNPSTALREIAQNNRWTIVVERKNSIYTLRPHGNSYILA